MFSVALIGPDGAGKTTIARMLEERSPLPLKYIYMGVNIAASNFALPSSRLVQYLLGHQNGDSGPSPSNPQPAQQSKRRRKSLGEILWATCRLANNLADEWYRQLWSWAYQCTGRIALYDRHYLFDFSLENVDVHEEGFDTRLHRWFLTHLYPRPSLVIFLDAPAEVLFARKGEKDLPDLNARRQSFARLMKSNSNCVVVDGTQPLPLVYDQVANLILQAYNKRAQVTRSMTSTQPQAVESQDRNPMSESSR